MKCTKHTQFDSGRHFPNSESSAADCVRLVIDQPRKAAAFEPGTLAPTGAFSMDPHGRPDMPKVRTSLLAALALAACADNGMSTEEIRLAAIERARQELGVPADTPLEATVWTGEEYDGDVVVCGTISDQTAGASNVVAQRFAASTEPFRWLIFEGAHEPMVISQPDKFPEWAIICDQADLD